VAAEPRGAKYVDVVKCTVRAAQDSRAAAALTTEGDHA